MCDEKTNELVKILIYKNKVVVFGFSQDEMTENSVNFFKNRFNHDALKVNLDKKDTDKNNISPESNDKFVECLKFRTKTNVVPMVFLNGMYIGSYKNIENMDYRRDFDIFF